MRTAVFVYDFPHRKSCEVLTRLWLEGKPVEVVVGSPFKAIPGTPPRLRVKPRRPTDIHPAKIAARMGDTYLAMDHLDEKLPIVLEEHGIEFGLIGGARILPREVIDAVSSGIVNLHPGLIPEVRGLDALKWTVIGGHRAGVTAHLIDHRVDAGRIILRKEIPVFADDTWIDLTLRLDDTEIDCIPEVIELLEGAPDRQTFPMVGEGRYNTRMSPEEEARAEEMFAPWRARMAGEDSR